MPPKANKPAAPKKPTKPSAKSKTGNTACSQAASNWQLSIRGKEPLDPQTYATLAKCRAMTRTAKQADDRARMGYNLNEQGAAALKGRLQKRFDQSLITQKSRDERLKMLLQQRKEKQAAVTAKPADPVKSPAIKSIKGTYHVTQHERNAIYQGFEQNAKEWKTQRKHYKIQNQSESGALLVITDNPGKKNQAEQKVYVTFKSNQKPTDKAAALVSSVRQKPGYGVAREAAKINKVNARFLNYNRNQEYQDYIEKQNPTLEAKRLMGEASELRRKAAEFNKSTNYSATKNKGKVETQSYSSGKGTRIVGFTENATSNIHRKMLEEAKQKLTRAKELEKQPAKPVVTRKEFNREYGKTNKGTVTTQPAVATKSVTQTVEKLTGTKAVAQRFENAENKFIEHAISHAGLTRPQAVTALNAMTKAKAVKIDPIIGQFSFTHGAFGDKTVIRRAAGIEPAKPTDKAASLVSSVRQKPGYQNLRTVLADNNKREVREKLISTFVADSIAGRRVPSKILDDMRDLRNSWISRAGGNNVRLPDHNARPTFYMRPPVDAKGSEKRSLEKKAENVRKFWRVGQNSEGGMDTTPLLHVAQASAAAKKAGKNHKLLKQPAIQPPKPAFSRQGQLAPGRGTPERNEMALMLRGARNTLKSLKDIGKKRLTESGRKGLITKASKQLSQLRSLARYGTNWANIKSYD